MIENELRFIGIRRNHKINDVQEMEIKIPQQIELMDVMEFLSASRIHYRVIKPNTRR